MGSANEKKMIFTDPETEEKIDELVETIKKLMK